MIFLFEFLSLCVLGCADWPTEVNYFHFAYMRNNNTITQNQNKAIMFCTTSQLPIENILNPYCLSDRPFIAVRAVTF
jgi:hypothetical protein